MQSRICSSLRAYNFIQLCQSLRAVLLYYQVKFPKIDCFCQFSREHSEKSLGHITMKFSVAPSTVMANTCKKFQIK